MSPALNSVLFIGSVAIFGLWIGALLARVIHALPLALEAAWEAQLADAQAVDVHTDPPHGAKASADAVPGEAAPASQGEAAHGSAAPPLDDPARAVEPAAPALLAPVPCDVCGARPVGWRTWPGLSAIAAPWHCAVCSHALPVYPRLVQWLTAAVLGACAWRFGATVHLLFAAVFCAVLIALAFIDARTTLLPDILTLPLLWLGLLVNSGAGWAPLSHAVWGAALGYGGLWVVYHAFRLMTGRDGMGYGDFKLLAALGAWLGVGLLPWMLLAASLAGVVAGVVLRLMGRARAGQPLPFGPYLSGAGIIALLGVAAFPGS